MKIALSKNLELGSVAALKASLASAFETDEEVVIDASAVTQVDTASLQLLVAFGKSRSFSIEGASEGFRVSADRLGLTEVLGISS